MKQVFFFVDKRQIYTGNKWTDVAVDEAHIITKLEGQVMPPVQTLFSSVFY